jgi:hypothetical protein
LETRKRHIEAVEIPAAQDAGDDVALGQLRAERDAIAGQLAALAEDELHAIRKAETEGARAERERFARERAEIEAKGREQGQRLEALAIEARAVLTAYQVWFQTFQVWNERARTQLKESKDGPPLLDLEQILGTLRVLGAVSRVVSEHAEVVHHREWNSPEAVARRAAEEAQERERRAVEWSSREALKSRGVLERWTAPRNYDGTGTNSDRRS